MRVGAHRMVDGHHRVFLGRGGASWVGAWWLLVFYYGFSKMDEIHIMCGMYMYEAGIPMLITMSKE